MFTSTRRPVRGAVIGVALATSLLSAPTAAFASGGGDADSAQNVNISIRGGDATAIAACVNVALQDEKKADHAKKGNHKDKKAYKKWRHSKVRQLNFCDNFAEARGGNVTLKNVDFYIDNNRDGKYDDAVQNVTITIAGGDATAVAACVNVFDGGNASVTQENDCVNSAFADGGDVNLKNVDFTIVNG